MNAWTRTKLGRTGLEVGKLGISGGYGVGTAGVERAFEHGVNYLYHGSIRRAAFSQALRNLAPKRDRFVLVIQSYSRISGLIGWSLERALRESNASYADVLLLGWWDRRPFGPILDAARKLRERGLVRYLAVSSHKRPLFQEFANNPDIGVLHIRYNAAHTGAEKDVFPVLPGDGARPGTVAYTATSWGQLMKPSKVPRGEVVPSVADCYRFVMSNPNIDVCMSGPANDVQAAQGLKALEKGPMSDEELAWMRRVGQAVHG